MNCTLTSYGAILACSRSWRAEQSYSPHHCRYWDGFDVSGEHRRVGRIGRARHGGKVQRAIWRGNGRGCYVCHCCKNGVGWWGVVCVCVCGGDERRCWSAFRVLPSLYVCTRVFLVVLSSPPSKRRTNTTMPCVKLYSPRRSSRLSLARQEYLAASTVPLHLLRGTILTELRYLLAGL